MQNMKKHWHMRHSCLNSMYMNMKSFKTSTYFPPVSSVSSFCNYTGTFKGSPPLQTLASSLASFRLHEETCQFVCGLHHMEGVLLNTTPRLKCQLLPPRENCRENQVNMEKAKEGDNLIAPPTCSSPLSTTVLLLYIQSRRGYGHSVCPLCCLFPLASICFTDAAPLDVMWHLLKSNFQDRLMEGTMVRWSWREKRSCG